MCMILVKPAGKELNFALEGHIRNAFCNNYDGFGYMYNDGQEVHIRKGFMTWKAIEKELKRIKPITKKYDFVFHVRWATHGTIGKGSTHPFPVTKDEELLWKTQLSTDIGIAHNGVISECGSRLTAEYQESMSDTQVFIRDYLSDVKEYLLSDGVARLILMATSSKFAIMTPTSVKIIGDFVKEKNGCYYSNRDYKTVYMKTGNQWFSGNNTQTNTKGIKRGYDELTGEQWKDDWENEFNMQSSFCSVCGNTSSNGGRWINGLMVCSKCSAEVRECFECGEFKMIDEMTSLDGVCQDCYNEYLTCEGVEDEDLEWILANNRKVTKLKQETEIMKKKNGRGKYLPKQKGTPKGVK